MPRDWQTIALVHALLGLQWGLAFLVARQVGNLPPRRRMARFLVWSLTIGFTVAIERLTANEPAGVRMIALILAPLLGMKTVVAVESEQPLSLLHWVGFSLFWFGMRPDIFARADGKPLPGARDLVVKGLVRMAIGASLIGVAWATWQMHEHLGADKTARWLATLPLLAGVSFFVHFGVFSVLGGCWRYVGVDCRPLFRAPVLSTSLNEFWSRRWNLAFSEMTALGVYRPLAGSLGRGPALAGAFLVSGLLHELAISVPVLAGFGGPMAYFLLHGMLVAFEKTLERTGLPVNRHRWLGRLWTWSAIVLPLPVLFHRAFLAGCVWPLVGME